MKKPDISIVIPLYNEADNIEPLGHAILLAMQGQNYEVIFVNDGSTDGSAKKLKEWCTGYTNFRTIHFRKNAGQTAAMDAALNLLRENMSFQWMPTCKMIRRTFLHCLKS